MTATGRVETNWLLIDDLDFWEEFTTKALKDDPTNTFFKQLDNAIDDKLSRTIEWLDSEEAQKYLKHETEYQKEVFEALEDEWDNILSGELNSVDQLLDKIYEQGKQKGYNDIREKIRYTDADRYALQFAKNYNFYLIQKLDSHVRDAVKDRVIQAEASGEHPYELASAIENIGVQPLPGSTLSARQRAVMIARTETARVQNTGIIQSYVNEGFTEVNILTAGDSSVCRLCLANAYEFNTDEIVLENRGEERVHKISGMDGDSWVPLHPNCRCTYTVVWNTRGEVPENPKPVNLTPLSDNELSILSMLYSGENGIVKELYKFSYKGIENSVPKKQFKEYCKRFIDEKDINLVDDLYVFQKKVKYINMEFVAARTEKGKYSGESSLGKYNRVELPKKFLKDMKEDDKILSLIHNHPESNPPLPSSDDLGYFASNEVKYGLITNKEGTCIIKNNNSSQNKDKSEKIIDTGGNIEDKLSEMFSEDTGITPPRTWNKYKSVEEYTPEEVKYFNKKYKYINEHKDECISFYEEELTKYDFEIKFIKGE